MKTVVITGVSRGLGAEIAQVFLDYGWVVFGLARSRITFPGYDNFHFHRVDLRDRFQIHDVFQCLPGIDVLVNNAGVFESGLLRNHTEEEIDSIISTNLLAPIFCVRGALPLMQNGSRIINISSVAGLHGIENQSIYCASKFGLAGFMESLDLELRERGIGVTTIYPGGINTPLWNLKNPYPGDKIFLLDPAHVAKMVMQVAIMPVRVTIPKIVMFPANERH